MMVMIPYALGERGEVVSGGIYVLYVCSGPLPLLVTHRIILSGAHL